MGKYTTVAQVNEVIAETAEREGITLEEAHKQVHERWQLIAFLGIWTSGDNEVLAPNSFPRGKPAGFIIV